MALARGLVDFNTSHYFFRSPRPIVVELLEQYDDEDGLPEKLAQKNPSYQK